MRVVLLGASGFVGSAILKEARDREHQVTALLRNQGHFDERLDIVDAAKRESSVTPETQCQIVMAERPSGAPALRHFKTVVSLIPPRPADAVLLRNIFVSIAPHARAVMQGPTYRPRLVAEELIPSSVIAEVIAGPADGPEPGSVVAATAGWLEYSVVPARAARPLQKIGRLSHHMGARNGLRQTRTKRAA